MMYPRIPPDYDPIPHPFEGQLKFLLVLAAFAAGVAAVGVIILVVRLLLR